MTVCFPLLRQGYDKLFLAEVDAPLLDALLLLAFALESTKEKVLSLSPGDTGWPCDVTSLSSTAADRHRRVSSSAGSRSSVGLECYRGRASAASSPADPEALVEKTSTWFAATRAFPLVPDACAGSSCIGYAGGGRGAGGGGASEP